MPYVESQAMPVRLSADELLTQRAFSTAEHLADALRRIARQHGLPVRSGPEEYAAQVNGAAMLLQLLIEQPTGASACDCTLSVVAGSADAELPENVREIVESISGDQLRAGDVLLGPDGVLRRIDRVEAAPEGFRFEVGGDAAIAYPAGGKPITVLADDLLWIVERSEVGVS